MAFQMNAIQIAMATKFLISSKSSRVLRRIATKTMFLMNVTSLTAHRKTAMEPAFLTSAN